jgi:hypothetical protein
MVVRAAGDPPADRSPYAAARSSVLGGCVLRRVEAGRPGTGRLSAELPDPAPRPAAPARAELLGRAPLGAVGVVVAAVGLVADNGGNDGRAREV